MRTRNLINILRSTFGDNYHPRSNYRAERIPTLKPGKDRTSPNSHNFKNMHTETSNVNLSTKWETLNKTVKNFPMPMTAPASWQNKFVKSKHRGSRIKQKKPYQGRN